MTTPTAQEITNKLLLAISRDFPAVAWRRNVGGGYPVATVKAAIGMLRRGMVQEAITFLSRARPVIFGIAGEPDVDGIMGPDGLRIGLEVKAGDDVQSDEQKICERVYTRHGAIYLIARDVEKTLADLRMRLEMRAK